MLKYVVAEHKSYPGDWHVEAVDRNGRVYIAVFSGQDAKDRAAEYAQWKNSLVLRTRVSTFQPAAAHDAVFTS